jgi:hypothetical protein
MPSLTFSIKTEIKEGLIISPSDFVLEYLQGVPLTGTFGGTISLNKIENVLSMSQELFEKLLGIKVKKQIIQETKSYNLDDWSNFLYLRTAFPVIEAFGMKGYYGNIPRIQLPKEWMIVKQTNTGSYHRKISLIPNSNGNLGNIIVTINSASSYYYRFVGFDKIPEYWHIEYLTGVDVNSIAILNSAIAKLAAIEILGIASNNILGPGVIGSSLSLDGLSQSIQTAKSSSTGAFSAITKQYADDLKDTLIPALKSYYKGVLFSVL